jgi:coenzyme F420-reducing hydrogenase delta subunit
MNMNIKEVMQKLDDYFDLSNKKQKEKHDKLLQIITRLEQNKSELKTEMIIESEKDNTSEEFHDLQKELKVISRLLKKARQHDAPEEEDKKT